MTPDEAVARAAGLPCWNGPVTPRPIEGGITNLNFRVAVGWNDELDRVYYVYDRFDDIWDRDAGGFGCCAIGGSGR